MKWIKKLFGKENKKHICVTYEKSDLERVFEELEDVAVKKMRLTTYLERLKGRKEELAIYEKLTKEELDQLTLLLGHYKAIEEKKQHLRGRLIQTNKALLKLEVYEAQLPEMIKEVNATEKRVKEYERDLFYLNEEKVNLEEDREVLLKGYTFLKYFIGATMSVAVIAIFLAIALLQVIREDMWIYLSGGCGVFILCLIGAFWAKLRLEKSLTTNEVLQKKAVKYMNKTKIHYFHHKRYLEFYFEKLGVDSAATLELYYNRYIKNKYNQDEYNRLNRQLMSIEINLEEIFKEKSIQVKEVDHLKEWIFSNKKADTLDKLFEEEQQIQTQITGFIAYEEELWKEIHTFKQNPRLAQKVEEKIEQYRILTKENLDKNVQYA